MGTKLTGTKLMGTESMTLNLDLTFARRLEVIERGLLCPTSKKGGRSTSLLGSRSEVHGAALP
ncbi:MAG: hypothetical protein ACI9KE_005376 [Polyangiales bacterium]|jgi:hypothetical protein